MPLSREQQRLADEERAQLAETLKAGKAASQQGDLSIKLLADSGMLPSADPSKKNRNLIEQAIHKTVGMFDVAESEKRNNIESTAAEFVKSVPLFIGGKRGLVLSTLAFGAGEVKVNHSLPVQGVELAAGLGKGFLTKSVFDVFGKKDWNFAKKGMAMGSSSRLIETGLTPENYLFDGKFDFGKGISRAAQNAGDVKALGVDVVTFGAAHFIPGAMSARARSNQLLTTTLTGSSFGFTAGALGELQQQLHDKQPLNYTKLFTAATKEGLLMGAAAATGHKLTSKALLMPSERTAGTDKVGTEANSARTGDASVALPLTASIVPRAADTKARVAVPQESTGERKTSTVAELNNDGATTNGVNRNLEQSKPENQNAGEKKTETTAPKERYGYVGLFLDPASITKAQNGLVIDGQNVPLQWKAPSSMHITEKFGVKESAGQNIVEQINGQSREIKVVGLAVDAKGVEALVVSVDGKTVREDGRPYHVTRSLAEGRRANESMAVVEKALAAEKARQSGNTSEIKPEDLERYSYRELKPEEQFDLRFEPRFEETQTTAPQEKVSKPKVEIPFENQPPKMQVITAIKNTPPDYFSRALSMRTPEGRIGSYFEMTPDQLKQALFQAKWEPYDPRDADGNPIIKGARGYRATIEGGRLGMTTVESLPADAKLYLADVKGTGNWSVDTVGAKGEPTNHVTMIVGEAEGKQVVWTFHPGEPVRPSALDSSKVGQALSESGIDLSGLPERGNGRRIAITRAQLDRINATLPPESQMNMAKIETEANIPADLPPPAEFKPAPKETPLAEPVEAVRLPELNALESLPNQMDRARFQSIYSSLPESVRARYVAKLNETIKNPNEVARTTGVRGIMHEMNRVQRIIEQAMETIEPGIAVSEPVRYLGYDNKAADFSVPPSKPLKAAIASNIPIVREGGKPYVYELNSSPRRLYGNDAQQRNQILKFQAAINEGTVSGATVEINGRISPEFVQWLNGKNVGDMRQAPDVEVLYNINLPSGGDYTFILKSAANNQGLKFTNSDRAFSPEDRQVINGIYKAIQDRSIGEIISGTNIESPPPSLAPYIGDPFQIRDLSTFNQYDRLRLESTWNKLRQKADSDRINVENPRNALSEYNTVEYINEATRWYQNHLKQNPQTAKAKAAYVIKDEAGISKVVDLTYQRAQEVKRYEIERQGSAEEVARQAEREALGYTGRKEGISLDMEHFIMDATQEHNKGGNRRGRSYDNPERFQTVDQVMEYMKGQDRKLTDMQVHDPVSGKTEVMSDVSGKQITQRSQKVQAENLERARQKVEQYEQRYEELKAKENRTAGEDAELRFLTSRHGGYRVHKSAIDAAQAKIDEIAQTRKRADRRNVNSIPKEERQAYFDEMKAKAAEYDRQTEALRHEMERRYKQVLGGDAEWNKLALRVNV